MLFSCDITAAICGIAAERRTLSMSCAVFGASAVMTSIAFASFGTPIGSCPNGFLYSSACNAANATLAVVNATCIGKASCSMLAEKALFGGFDPCYGLSKSLAVVAVCGNATGARE